MIIGGALLLGFVPIADEDTGSIGALLVTLTFVIGFCVLAAYKGKLWSTMGGAFIPLVSIVAAIRVARPDSPWARRFYAPGSRKLTKSERREGRLRRRRDRFLDAIGGAPSQPSPRAKAEDS